jgi:hypothetical protein
MPYRARIFMTLVSALGCGAVALAMVKSVELPLRAVALLAVAVIVTELMQVVADESAGPERTHFSFSAGAHLAAIVALGPWGAALLAALGVAFVDRLRGVSLKIVVFNGGAFALSTIFAGNVYILAGGHPGSVALPHDLAPLALLAIVAYLGNLSLVTAIAALASGQRIVRLASETARGQILSALSEAGFGVALGYFVVYQPWAAITLGPLVLGAYKAHARLELQRRETTHALETFARVVDERDTFTSHHSARVAEFVAGFARWAEMPARDVARLRWAGQLHDLGKVVVDTSVLHKPGSLDEGEWAVVRRHPRVSARILRRFNLAADEATAVEYHHERFDGAGYYGVAPQELPIAAHILIVADSFDAMTSDRPYRGGMPKREALAEIEREGGTQFHPLIARAFAAYQRGIAVEDVLTETEQRELCRPWTTPARRRRRIAVRVTPQTVGVTAALAGLVLLLPRAWPAAAGAFAVAIGAVGWSGWSMVVRERVVRELRARASAEDVDGRLAVVAEWLAERAGLVWAGLVQPDPLERGTLAATWLGHGPAEDAVLDWLARGLESDDLHVADAADLGLRGSIACLPLGERGARGSYLILLFAHAPAAAFAAALSDYADEIGEAAARVSASRRPVLTAVG